MHLPLGPFGAAQFRPPPALSPLPRATRTTSKLPTDRQNWNAAFIAFDTERNSRICGYGDTLPNPLSRRFRSPLAWPRIAPRERREAIQEGGRSERAADRFRAAQGRVGPRRSGRRTARCIARASGRRSRGRRHVPTDGRGRSTGASLARGTPTVLA